MSKNVKVIFCFFCGNQLVDNQEDIKERCPVCGTKLHYHSVKTGNKCKIQ